MCHLQYCALISFYISSKDQNGKGDESINISTANQSFLTLVEARGDERQNANLYVRGAGRFLTCKTCHLSVYPCGGEYSEGQADVER